MIDPLIQLAFNVHGSPGVFAILLGSGVSRASGIPTGWEVVLDLIRRVAALEGEDCDPDPEAWYVQRYDDQPDYSSLLDRLAPTPALRQQQLRAYFEPTEQEREQGRKVPTAAHHAIAKLVRRGAFRVIITTNFDRLVEAALEAEGIIPTVISSSDDVKGATPIVHSGCTLIKLHGDYLDTRIKNSPAELQRYDKTMDRLLDRVFDEFGLVICGWSAEYDTALRSAIRRASSRRYPLFWASRGKLSTAAEDLVKFKRAEEIGIEDADQFFLRLEEKHAAIERYAEPHPLSKVAALQTLRRYMSTERFKISLYDFVRKETKRTRMEIVSSNELKASQSQLSIERLAEIVRTYEQKTTILRGIFGVGTSWAKSDDRNLWAECFSCLAYQEESGSGLTTLIKLRMYPALLLIYSIGVSSVLSTRYGIFADVCYRKPATKYGDGEEFGLGLHGAEVIDPGNANQLQNYWLGTNKRYWTPLSDHLYELIKEDLDDLVLTEEQFRRAFDKFEYLAGLVHLDIRAQKHPEIYTWLPVGAYRWRSWGRYSSSYHVAKELEAEVARDGSDWPPLRAGLFGGDSERLKSVMKSANEWLSQVPWDF
jgi:hypothetical protein